MSIAITGTAPTNRAMCVPTPPTPQTPTDSPMPTRPVRTTAPNGIDTASARMAACSSGTLSGTLVSPTACATVYSAHAPSCANAINCTR